jgi:hypothetical protein
MRRPPPAAALFLVEAPRTDSSNPLLAERDAMPQSAKPRYFWITLGVIAGLGIANFWPHEQALAEVSDRDAQFGLCTANVNLIDPIEGVFVLDFLTATLKGAIIHRQSGKFLYFYERNLATDFELGNKKDPKFAFVTGTAQLNARGAGAPASSLVYVAELTTGKLIAYAFEFRDNGRPYQGSFVPMDVFQFRPPASN